MARTLEPNGAVPTVPGTFAWISGRMCCWAGSARVPSDWPLPVSTRQPIGTLPVSLSIGA